MRYIIDVRDDIPNACKYVDNVINDKTYPYCALTVFVKESIMVSCDKTKTGYKFIVYREKKNDML